MRKIVVLFAYLLPVLSLSAQNTFRAVIKDRSTLELLQGVTVSSAISNSTTASNGRGIAVLGNLTAGQDTIHFTYVGYKAKDVSVTIPDTTVHAILMEQDEMA